MELTCGTCQHWHKQPADAMNLGQPAQGQCRAIPPACVPVGMSQQGRLNTFASYPMLPDSFPACGMHKVRLSAEAHALLDQYLGATPPVTP